MPTLPSADAAGKASPERVYPGLSIFQPDRSGSDGGGPFDPPGEGKARFDGPYAKAFHDLTTNREIPAAAKAAYFAITSHTRGRGQTCATDADLARDAGYSVGHFRRQLPILVEAGWIRLEYVKKDLANHLTGRWILVPAELHNGDRRPEDRGGVRAGA